MRRATSVIRWTLSVNFVILVIFFGRLHGLEYVEEYTATTPRMVMMEDMEQSILNLDDGGNLIDNNATR